MILLKNEKRGNLGTGGQELRVAAFREAWEGHERDPQFLRKWGFSYLPEAAEVEEGSGAGGRDSALWRKGGEQVSRCPTLHT